MYPDREYNYDNWAYVKSSVANSGLFTCTDIRLNINENNRQGLKGQLFTS